MAQRACAIFTALLIVTYICFPTFGVFARASETDALAIQGASAATGGVTATDGTTDTNGSGDNPQDEDSVASFEDLQQWLNDNKGSGKTVILSDTIQISSEMIVRISGVTVDTANHGLVIKSIVWLMDGGNITGGGVNEPVITIAEDGRLDIQGPQSEIAATGADGIGGCAIKIEDSGTFEVLTGWCSIRAEGTDAVGIYADTGLELSDVFITSDGTGVEATGDVELFLCDISADIPIESTGGIFLDTCLVNEPIANATVINRSIIDIDKENLHKLLPLNRDISSDLFDNNLTIFLGDDIEWEIPVSWDISETDASKADKYEVIGTISAPYDRFNLDAGYPVTATVEIVDASFPVLYKIESRLIYIFYFLYDAEDLSGLTIWRSDDDGVSWYNYTENAYMYSKDDMMLTFSRAQEHPVQLVFEVAGYGESQLLLITWDYDSGVHTDVGGDRNGGDRVENTLPSVPPSKSGTTSAGRSSITQDKLYEPAEAAYNDEATEPVIESEALETISGNEISAPSTEARGASSSQSQSQSPKQPLAESASDMAQDTAPSAAEAEKVEAVQTAVIQEIADAPVEEAAGKTENAQDNKTLSDTVIPIAVVSTMGLVGAGAYLGAAGKFSLHSLIKLVAGRLGL